MARRRVTGTRKDPEGDILGLCGPDFIYVSRDQAIREIRNNVHEYFVRVGVLGVEAQIKEVAEPPYLRTFMDDAETNNLDNLPDC